MDGLGGNAAHMGWFVDVVHWVACHDGVWVDMLIILSGSSWNPRWPMRWFVSIVSHHETHLFRC